MKTCYECGCPYNETASFCPECGAPNNSISGPTKLAPGVTNCPNCGAPITNRVSCEYCESLLPQPETHNQVIINNNQSSDSAGAAIGAALLGGIIGGIFGD